MEQGLGAQLLNAVPEIQATITRYSCEAAVAAMMGNLGFDVSLVPAVHQRCLELASWGIVLDDAEASFVLMVLDQQGEAPDHVVLQSCLFNITVSPGQDSTCEAIVKVKVRQADGETKEMHTVHEAPTEIRALNVAIKKAIGTVTPDIVFCEDGIRRERFKYSDGHGDDIYRVHVPFENCTTKWTTVGIGVNLLEAFANAFIDGYRYAAYKGLLQ